MIAYWEFEQITEFTNIIEYTVQETFIHIREMNNFYFPTKVKSFVANCT